MNKLDSAALAEFDLLPDAAFVRLPVVAALYCVSPATIWRWAKAGHIPAPVRIAGVTLWSVASLRKRAASECAN